MPKEPFRSPTPRQVFSQTLAEQEKELKTNVLMLRFAESRKKLAADPYRPAYHFVSPESMMNDPNGLCFWQGRWHLFYQVFPPDAFPDPKDRREPIAASPLGTCGHRRLGPLARSALRHLSGHRKGVRFRRHGGREGPGRRVLSGHRSGPDGGDREGPAAAELGETRRKVRFNSPSGDSCIWKEGDTYFGLVVPPGPAWFHRRTWSIGPITASFWKEIRSPLAMPWPAPVSCRSATNTYCSPSAIPWAAQYLLGDYDRQRHQFKPYEHGRFNHGTVAPGGVHAPTGVADGKGGVINILNINDGRHTEDWDQLMSLAQHLTLGPDKKLRIEPVEAVASLRGGHQHVGETVLPANQEIVLEAIKGNAMELEAEIDPKDARWVQLNVLRSPNAEEQTSITFYNYDRPLAFWYHTPGRRLPGWLAQQHPAGRMAQAAGEERSWSDGGEPLKLRVFVDHSVVEVFVNEKLYLAMRVYPGRKDSLGVSLRAQGQDAVLKKLDAWQMKPIWPHKE